ncbi:unnamed protein product [Closterium sp. Naga37s-1]|nr:unnamed protein product [Closterium sp. Naga37s-1]
MAVGSRGRPRPASNGRLSGAVLVLMSCLATLYTGGRLWRDVQVQKKLLQEAKGMGAGGQSKQDKSAKPLSVEDSILTLKLRELEKRHAMLQVQMAEAKTRGFISAVGSASPDTSAGGGVDAAGHAGAVAGGEGAAGGGGVGGAGGAGSGAGRRERLLVAVLVSTAFGNRLRREAIRSTWMPTGAALKKLQDEMGVVLRFAVGHSLNRGDSLDRAMLEERDKYNDIVVMDEYEEVEKSGGRKVKHLFEYAVRHWDADFYFKVNDDVYLSTMQLVSFLQRLKDRSGLYMGCFKSGVVVTEPNQQWFEPEWARFGDGKQYFQHAAAPVYGLSRDLALFLAFNGALLHEYANEDVSVGSWMMGLTATHHNDHRLCCASPPEEDCGRKREENKGCVAVSDWRCGGLFTTDTFDDLSPTIGVDFKLKSVTVNGKRIKLTIWDTAGQERFRTLTSSYYRGAQGIILVYDVTRRDTFTNLSDVWLKEIDMYSTVSDCVLMLVGNKVDKESERQVAKEEGIAFARQYGSLFLECSAKTRLNVQQCFSELVQKIIETPSLVAHNTHTTKVLRNLQAESNPVSDPSGSCGC